MFNPSAGYRNRTNGLLNNQGTNGNYWSSTVNLSSSRQLTLSSSLARADFADISGRANGYTVRCLKNP